MTVTPSRVTAHGTAANLLAATPLIAIVVGAIVVIYIVSRIPGDRLAVLFHEGLFRHLGQAACLAFAYEALRVATSTSSRLVQIAALVLAAAAVWGFIYSLVWYRPSK